MMTTIALPHKEQALYIVASHVCASFHILDCHFINILDSNQVLYIFVQYMFGLIYLYNTSYNASANAHGFY